MFFLHLQSCNLGTHVRKVKNPFTGEALAVPIDLGLTSSERDAVRALLAEVGASPPDLQTPIAGLCFAMAIESMWLLVVFILMLLHWLLRWSTM